MTIATVGFDLAKNVFQVHAIDSSGRVLARKVLRRGQVLPFFAKLAPCLVGMEACGTRHYWGRQLSELGHEVRLMSPAYVKIPPSQGAVLRARNHWLRAAPPRQARAAGGVVYR